MRWTSTTATRDLSDEEAAWVDAEVAESADGRLGWGRFEAVVEGKVAAAAPEAAAAKERAAAMEHGIRPAKVNKHGTATLTVRGDAATIMSIDHAARVRAKELEEAMPGTTFGQRQVAALAGRHRSSRSQRQRASRDACTHLDDVTTEVS